MFALVCNNVIDFFPHLTYIPIEVVGWWVVLWLTRTKYHIVNFSELNSKWFAFQDSNSEQLAFWAYALEYYWIIWKSCKPNKNTGKYSGQSIFKFWKGTWNFSKGLTQLENSARAQTRNQRKRNAQIIFV